MSAVMEVAAALRVQADALEAQARALRAQAAALETVVTVTPLAPVTSTPPLLDKQELARQLGVSPATVDRLDRAGQPFVRVGDAKRYDLAAVHAWHRERSVSTTPPAHPPAPEPSGVRLLSRRRGGVR